MIRLPFRQLVLGMVAMPLALGLAACGKKDDATTGPTSGEPVAKVAAPAGKAWADVIEKTPEGGYRIGNPNAAIKVVEYGALSCSHCAEFAKESFETIRDNYVASGRVSYELRFFMLNVLDVPATLLATCGSTEAVIPLAEQFWGWQPKMFENMQAARKEQLAALDALPKDKQLGAVAQVSGMNEFFASRGIATDQANACIGDVAKAKALADQTQKATDEFQVTGTPTFIINGNNVGSMAWKELEAKIQQAGAR